MSKPFRSHNQQLKILRKRNMIVSNGAKAKAILVRENYYLLINGYKDIFLDLVETEKRKSDYFKDGTKFEHVFSLYEFDRNLRNILIKYLLMAENSIKSKIAYRFSEAYKTPFSYFNINNFCPDDREATTELITILSNVVKNNTDSKNVKNPFCHYFNHHKELPLWVLVTKMTLGQICKFYYCLSHYLKVRILNDILYELRHECSKVTSVEAEKYISEFSAILNCLNRFRNVCAHEDRLYNYEARNRRNKKIVTNFFYLKSSPNFDGKVFDLILLLRLFLTKKNFKNLTRQISNEVDDLATALPENLYSEVLRSMRFPKRWKSVLKDFE